MQYLDVVAASWIWFVVALLLGGAVGYAVRARLAPRSGRRHAMRWGMAAVLIGLLIAALAWLPQRPGPDLAMVLSLALCCAIGGGLGAVLRGTTSGPDSISAARLGSPPPEAAALAERTRAVVKSAQDERAASARSIEDARLVVEAKAAEVSRIAAAAKAVDDARLAAQAEAKAAEEKRIAASARAVEDARVAVEAKATQRARIAAAAKAAADAHHAVEANAAAETRRAIEARIAGGAREAAAKAANDPGVAPPNAVASEAVSQRAGAPPAAENKAKGRRSSTAEQPREAEQPATSRPASAAPLEGEDRHPGRRPDGLAGAIGAADNLKKIRGIGPQNERRLHALGIWHFSQIAAWSEDNVKWVGSYLSFAGRIDREQWVAQARDLAAGTDSAMSGRGAAGKDAKATQDRTDG